MTNATSGDYTIEISETAANFEPVEFGVFTEAEYLADPTRVFLYANDYGHALVLRDDGTTLVSLTVANGRLLMDLLIATEIRQALPRAILGWRFVREAEALP